MADLTLRDRIESGTCSFVLLSIGIEMAHPRVASGRVAISDSPVARE